MNEQCEFTGLCRMRQEYLGIGGGTGEPAKDTETFDELFFNLSELENLGKGSAGLLAHTLWQIRRTYSCTAYVGSSCSLMLQTHPTQHCMAMALRLRRGTAMRSRNSLKVLLRLRIFLPVSEVQEIAQLAAASVLTLRVTPPRPLHWALQTTSSGTLEHRLRSVFSRRPALSRK